MHTFGCEDVTQSAPPRVRRSLPDPLAELAKNPQIRELIQEILDTANAEFAPPERIRRFAILDRSLTVEDGELTPTLKVRRNFVAERYKSVVDALYD